ncbi:MAG: T9SS type A sorting domain-containing protein [Candidatus Tenebribacter burtonii]|nr:T9SS type A sorting domain-containing protein [Candidatus Tenebribacter burtonii]
MKKNILLVLLILSLSLVFAELEIDVPFDMDIVGQSFAANGAYVYESDWITITNIGSTSENYTLFYSNYNVPANWYLSICNSSGVCFMANFPGSIPLEPGEILEIHISISVANTSGFPFSIILDGGDLTEPISLDFTFRTEDYIVSADNGLAVPEKLSQNYPNPFNPSTTISYELTQQELASASITIYNTKGQLVRTFKDLNTNGNIVWDGKDNNNNIVNSGVYFYKLNLIKTSIVKKMILIK